MSVDMQQMLEAANAVVPRISPGQVQALIAQGNVLIVDVREPAEVQASGKVAGAATVPRGILESRADPSSPYHNPAFDKGKTVILYCASGARSALGGKLLKDMGYEKVFNLGGFQDWALAGGAVERGA
ncbi:MAG TPA: rhodanese-like domain-containing protein [Rhizomicrobium sp.]|jgi:rhodanese-related sulfurtransferase|nr:rhodanese-like domain-containing protein [Rhizomicrobium sp.]